MMNKQALKQIVDGKKVLFVSSKNADYIRNVQEIEFLKKEAMACDVIASSSKSYLKRIIYTYWKMLTTKWKNYDYIFIGFAPQLYSVFFPFVRKEQLIIDFFISIYDTMVDDRKKVKDNSLLAKLMHKIDGYTIKKAKYIVCDTKAHRDYFVEEFDSVVEKYCVLYLEADVSIYNPEEYVTTSDDSILEVIYFGSILPVQGIEVILDTIKLLKDNGSIRFTIVGPIENSHKIEGQDYPNTTFIPWLSQKELAEKIAFSDICLAGHFSATIGKANRTIAGKTYIYKAMNKAVILGDSQANHELFVEDEMHYFVERGNPEALAQLLERLQNERRKV